MGRAQVRALREPVVLAVPLAVPVGVGVPLLPREPRLNEVSATEESLPSATRFMRPRRTW
jgi:hypothetical protein